MWVFYEENENDITLCHVKMLTDHDKLKALFGWTLQNILLKVSKR